MSDAIARNGWIRVAFSEMAHHIAERVNPTSADGELYVGLEHLDPGALSVRRWGTDVPLIGTKLRMRKGDILFARRNAYLRRVAIAPHDGLFSAHGMVLRARAHVVLPEFLPFFMQSDVFMDRAEQISVGSLSPTINWGTLSQQQFFIPSLPEQRRMSELLKGIRETQQSYVRLDESFVVVLDALISRFLEKLKRMPLSFLSDYADVRYGLTVDPKRRMSSQQIPYLRVANVMRGTFELDDIKTVGRMPEDEIYRLEEGDVLIVEGHASVDQIGRCAVWQRQKLEMFHQNHLIRVRCGDVILPDYLKLLINSSYGQAYFRSRAKSTSGLNTINSTVVKQFKLPIPHKNVQKQIVAKTTQGSSLTEAIQHRLKSVERFKRIVFEALLEANK